MTVFYWPGYRSNFCTPFPYLRPIIFSIPSGLTVMRLSIRTKLFAALLIITTLVVAGMYGFMQWSFERGFMRFVESRQQERIDALKARLTAEYVRDGGWRSLRQDKRRWVELLREGQPDKSRHGPREWFRESDNRWPPHPPERLEKRRYLPLAFRLMLLDADQSIIFGRGELMDRLQLTPIVHEGETIGYLGLLPGTALNQLVDFQFMEAQTQSFILIALVMVLFSATLAFPLAFIWVKPLQRITDASKALAVGRYDIRLPVESNDELGQLARDFNDLAHALDKAEQTRRHWVADVSHELRTPLAVLRGELEALQDGVRPLNRQAIDSLHADVMRLNRLAEDLYQLSLSDVGTLSYRKAEVDAVAILREDLDHIKEAFGCKSISVTLENRLDDGAILHADADRLSQLFRNLLSNSLRYTEAGGQLKITVHRRENRLVLDFQDSAPGVSETDLVKLFDRFYRVESSRSRGSGGAGLGLAICRNIVEAHEGQITASASPLGGLRVHIELPTIS